MSELKKGRFQVDVLNKYTVQIEVDNKSIDFLIETLLELKNEPGMHHINLDSNTGYSFGYMTKESLNIIINNRDKY